MNFTRRFETAIDSVLSLRITIEEMRKEGFTHQELLQALEDFREILQAEGKENEEDFVLEVMDFLAGWCNPQMRIK